jgi:hypothetical protein
MTAALLLAAINIVNYTRLPAWRNHAATGAT